MVLALGTEFSETDVIYTGIPLPTARDLVMVDVDPAQLSAHRPRIGVCADVGTFLSALLGVLPEPVGVEPGGRGHSGPSAPAAGSSGPPTPGGTGPGWTPCGRCARRT